MKATLARILALIARGDDAQPPALDGFLDTLLQKFENCRPGLPDAEGPAGGEAAQQFFADLFEAERPRLADLVRQSEPLLSPEGHSDFVRKVEELVRGVVIPAYVRLAARYTQRERNDFYVVPAPFHLAERILWGVAGIVLGTLIVEAPFIPIWSKEIIFPLMVGGLLFPNLRRYLLMRRFERDVNALVGRADREIARIDTAYLMAEEPGGEGTAEGRREASAAAAGVAAAATKEGAR